MAVTEPGRLWPAVLTVSTVLAVLTHLIAAPAALRVLAVFWFVGICPGMAYVRLLWLADPVSELTLAVALSLSVTALVAETLAITRLWSPTGLLVALSGFTLLGVALQLRSPPGHTTGSFSRKESQR